MTKNIELIAITEMPNGDELIQTGVWVRSNITLDGIIELFQDGMKGQPVHRIEFRIAEKEEDAESE